jgi:Ca2+:H+ antiporter
VGNVRIGSASAGGRRAGGRTLTGSDLVIIVGSVILTAATGVARYVPAPMLLTFALAALGVALLAGLIARSVEQLGDRLGAGATGVLQSAVGNLPEILVAYFALRAGLRTVVQYTIIGSMLTNLLLVLGSAFLVGGLRHGTLRFEQGRARDNSVLLLLATAALLLPSLAQFTHSPAAPHVHVLSTMTAVVLLIIFVLSLPSAVSRRPGRQSPAYPTGAVMAVPRWPIWLAIGLLVIGGVVSAAVSDWFVETLEPVMSALHLSPAFTGLVVVAIAGNAIENAVGLQLAFRNQADYALSIIIHSPLQAALLVAPALVLISQATPTTLTLVFAPLLVSALVVAVLLVTLVVFDGESNWLEGAILAALYIIVAALFSWG